MTRPRKARASVLDIARRSFVRSEKDEERLCDDLILKMGGEVVRFSQARATKQTPGIPDRLYRCYGRSFWFEVKAADGKLTVDQLHFLRRELDCGNDALCGSRTELVAYFQRKLVSTFARDTVEAWAARGLRRIGRIARPL